MDAAAAKLLLNKRSFIRGIAAGSRSSRVAYGPGRLLGIFSHQLFFSILVAHLPAENHRYRACPVPVINSLLAARRSAAVERRI